MTKPRGLGRGLDALLGGTPVPPQRSHPDDIRGFPEDELRRPHVNAVQMVAISDIEANPNQPRNAFDDKGLKELAESIATHGIIQPITLRKIRASKYQIISGERRFRASQQAGLTELPAYVRSADDQSLLEMALVENIQREDLNPIDVGLSFRRLMEECDLTQESLAKRVGMGRSSVANHLRMLDLPETIQSMLRDGQLSLGHGKALAGVRGSDARYTQIALAEKAATETASVRELERWIQEGKLKHSPKGGQRMAPSALTADEAQMLDILRTKLHSTKAKVALKRRGTHGGQLTLSYANVEELEAVLAKLGVS